MTADATPDAAVPTEADTGADTGAEHDPFAAFDAAAGIGQVDDIHPVFHQMRSECPVHVGNFAHRFGFEDVFGDAMASGSGTPHAVLSFEAVQQVLKDGATFSSSGYTETIGALMGHSILEMDEPEHHQYRALLQQAFTRKAMERWERDLVVPVVNELIDAFVERGSADLVKELFFPFPVTVIAGMLGLPTADLPEFHRKAVELITIISDIETGLNASVWLHEYFSEVIAERRADPREDVISVLTQAELDGQRLDDEEIIAFLRLLLPAGAETTYRSSSNLMFGLLSNPDQLEALRADRALMPQAIEEGIRWEPPLTGIARTATRDVEVAGVTIPAGSTVQVEMGAANRDPARWERSDEFDLHRDPQPHMGFAFGVHMCLGIHLARMETSVVINAVLDRLPNVHLDPSAADVRISGLAFRAPPQLPVVFG